MEKTALLSFALTLMAATAFAQGAAPEMFGVREVVIEYVHFDDPKASDICGLTREQVAWTLAKALNGTGVPAVAATDAKPPVMGVARIELIPTISTRTNESLDCISWVSLQAENRVNAVIPPVATLRTVNVVYWRQHTTVATSQSLHQEKTIDAMEKMAAQFAQQYRLDQPPELSQ